MNEEEKPWYDTKEGIEKSVGSLTDFLALLAARHDAGYKEGGKLEEFYVLGHFRLDSCGNCGRIEKHPRWGAFRDIPDVLTAEEFWKFMAGRIDAKRYPLAITVDNRLPLADQVCPVCGQGWNMKNCHDTIVHQETRTISLADFVGKTLGEVKAHYTEHKEAIYIMQPDILIRNDRFVDLSPAYPDAEKNWQKEIVKNKSGWVGARDGIDDSYVIQKGDKGYFNVRTHYHGKCNREHLAQDAEKRFREIFQKAGFKRIIMLRTQNQYCGCDQCAPWFNVNTEFGTLLVGWRKHVINIDWSKVQDTEGLPAGTVTEKLGPNLLPLFTKESVTKDWVSIHAHGWDKAREYLTKIHSHLEAK